MKMRKMSLERKRGLVGYVFIAPVLLGLGYFFVPSVIESIIYAFNIVTVEAGRIDLYFVGLQHFSHAFFVDTEFRVILLNALSGMVLDTIVISIFSFFIANILVQKFIGRSFFRTILFMPVILATGIVARAGLGMPGFDLAGAVITPTETAFEALTIMRVLDIDYFTRVVGLPMQLIEYVLYAVFNTYRIVNRSGVQILIFISAIQSISPSLYEASKIEGATRWEEFWKITFPMITPMIFVSIIYTIIDTFVHPEYGVIEYIRFVGFIRDSMGLASALAWIYFMFILLFIGIVTLLLRRRIVYLDE